MWRVFNGCFERSDLVVPIGNVGLNELGIAEGTYQYCQEWSTKRKIARRRKELLPLWVLPLQSGHKLLALRLVQVDDCDISAVRRRQLLSTLSKSASPLAHTLLQQKLPNRLVQGRQHLWHVRQ